VTKACVGKKANKISQGEVKKACQYPSEGGGVLEDGGGKTTVQSTTVPTEERGIVPSDWSKGNKEYVKPRRAARCVH